MVVQWSPPTVRLRALLVSPPRRNTVTKMNTGRPIPWTNLLLLLFAAVVSMATLKGEGGDNHGEASAKVEWLSWNDQHRQRLTVTIFSVDERLAPLDYVGPIYLQVGLRHVPESVLDSPRWAASGTTSEGDVWALDGEFTDVGAEIDQSRSHDISAQVGRLCEGAETVEDGCIPCYASVGCVLSVEVDFCYVVGDHTVGATVSLTDSSGQPFSFECLEDTDSEPCTRLRDWIDAVGASSDPGLCPGA
jgi:hypothetical protein